MCVVCIEEDWQIGFFAQALHESGKLARAKEILLSFRRADNYGISVFTRGGDNCFQQDQVSDIEVTDGYPGFL
jgi:hypothetical protein